jgi:hypothetical protein
VCAELTGTRRKLWKRVNLIGGVAGGFSVILRDPCLLADSWHLTHLKI